MFVTSFVHDAFPQVRERSMAQVVKQASDLRRKKKFIGPAGTPKVLPTHDYTFLV